MKVIAPSVFILVMLMSLRVASQTSAWIRINQLGYASKSSKVAVFVSTDKTDITSFDLVDAKTSKSVLSLRPGKDYGAYGPFKSSYRLDFSACEQKGDYFIKAGAIRSPDFTISGNVYNGAADFALRYMRQQRSGYNPFLKDSCHTEDGYTVYGPMPDGTYVNVSGGWHDATDYLQYATTSANATYHLLAAFRDFPSVFSDNHLANGLAGKNGNADVLDEAKWGLEWLLKMHPKEEWMFNQLADDRDHIGFRLPTHDSADYGYGKGNGRPVYFLSGEVQGLGKYKNRATGTASTAGKFASAFALGAQIYKKKDPFYAQVLHRKSLSAFQFGLSKPGVAQTAPMKGPYFYEEDNWVDDMELGAAAIYQLTNDEKYAQQALQFSSQEKITPWIGADTAVHYQWYPFHNFGHYELAKVSDNNNKAKLISYYKEGIEKVWKKASQNAFYRGVPFIWCSNNLTSSFAIQCYLYRKLTGDNQYLPLEEACFDWLFGCNPWGTSMVYGLPRHGDTPVDPHSSLTVLHKYPLDGGLVDGPVSGYIYNSLLGLSLADPDEYAEFQSMLAVYHDDHGDYSTNEPTMDGTASLVYLLGAKENDSRESGSAKKVIDAHGAIIRGDVSKKEIALVFTGDEFADGGEVIGDVLKKNGIRGSFFLTGNFYRTKAFSPIINRLKTDGHYLAAHSDKHLLYADWLNRDSLLITRNKFVKDLNKNYKRMETFGIKRSEALYFLPPYEWYNRGIVTWISSLGLVLVNLSPGTRSAADYTYPGMKAYRSSDEIYNSIMTYEQQDPNGLNGFILLMHIGTDTRRIDKFYYKLDSLIQELKNKGYAFVKITELLKDEAVK